ncbi:V-type proton ATPase subunit d 1 isoform X4 [Calonectris borealis]|uniref:V-type proton ATPase subunit d 1 isoform X4 n=1 Tax=Calonectris borealis TaxID=1323832 RepID=UPI003F4C2392
MSSFPELYFNVDNGYLEGLVRGFKAGVLRQGDYVNLVQCESLEDLKLHLQSTDYGNFLANEASPLTVSVIDDKLKEKMVVEFRHMRNHAYEPLASFLDFITYSYMIDNVILLITGTLHQRSISELVPKCHPLGSFEQMEAVNIAQTPAELYNAILVDTPLAAFFQDCISEQDLDEMNIEIIRNTLYKAYLESFYKFCKVLGGTTADAMCPILEHPHAHSACSLGDLGKHCLHMTLDRFGSPVLILPDADTSVAFVATSSSSHMDNEQENNQSCSVHGPSPCQG